MKTNSITEREEIEKKFQNIIQQRLVKPCDQHETHQYELWVPASFLDIQNQQPPPTCGLCNMYLFGIIFPGYYCKTCSKFYHHKCFTDGKVDPAFVQGNYAVQNYLMNSIKKKRGKDK